MAAAFEAFRSELFARAKDKGFEDFELYYSGNNGFSVRVFQGEISEYTNSNQEGVCFRGTFGGKMGYAYSEKISSDVIESLIENAVANAGIIEDEDTEKLYPGDETYPEVNSYNEAINDIDAAQKIQWALEMEKYALSLDPRVKMADYCTVSNSESSMAIANSGGLNLTGKRNMAAAYLIARAEENGVTKSGFEFWNGRDFADFDYKVLAKKAVDKALSYLGASSIPSGEYPVVFNEYTAINIFEVFSKVFFAELGQKGFSLLSKSRIGKEIAAAHVTLCDDGVASLSLESRAFDAEGVATKNKAVIENGVLKTLLYNTKAAEKDGVKSTGNASKQDLGGAISTSATNLYLVPGEKTQDELIASVEKGVMITELQGLHSGASTVSGDFSFSADGYYIENGKITKPVEQITVAGNFFELLKKVETVGSNLRFSKNIGMPSIKISGLNIAGL